MTDSPQKSIFARVSFWLLASYLLLLLGSHLLRLRQSQPPLPPEKRAVSVQAASNPKRLDRPVRLAYREFSPAAADSQPVLILLHGSPMGSETFDDLGPALGKKFRVIVPDLPGFGDSSADIPDYSNRAHADYILQLMDRLGVSKAHLIAYSMSGGVALRMAHRAPERVASIDMLSAIGVQELELLGNYYLNHSIHALQLGALWFLQELLPQFGVLDRFVLNVRYARNFYDTDQRPLRGYLQEYEGPMLIQHGVRDGLVPIAAAREHHRLVPQSILKEYDAGHGMVFMRWPMLVDDIVAFVRQVERGEAPVRATARPERIRAAALPFNPSTIPPAHGIAFALIMFLLVVATLVSEDLTCIGAGLIIARGTISFLSGTFACFVGILFGDVGLYLAGRYFGRPAVARAPLRWFLSEAHIARSAKWFEARGPSIIIASRFLPGSRLPTYFASGVLRMRFLRFLFYFFIATAIWTPILVGLATVLGKELFALFATYQTYALLAIATTGVTIFLIVKVVVPLFSYRGRRLLLSAYRRKRHWEFWPWWLLYVPVFFYVLYLGLKHRSLTLFTLANPGMPDGGFIGESKSDILAKLDSAGSHVARHVLLPHAAPVAERLAQARSFLAKNGLNYPVVLKPDAGERGAGVAIIRSEAALEPYVRNTGADVILQEYAAGAEFGVFYVRHPAQAEGRLFSITDKRFPTVTGDGQRTLEELVLADDRAVCLAPLFLEQLGERGFVVPRAGERVPLVEIGTHARGALFLDGSHVHTQALQRKIDAISKTFAGFFFGRFDIRTPDIEAFKQGHNFKIVELNGVTSEATHIYDPKNSLWIAYRVLMQQWRLAFEIGAENARRGGRPASVRHLLEAFLRAKRPRRCA